MNDLIEVYQRIAPELMRTVEERYTLLSHISYAQPVGRRLLASMSKLSERVVRSHVEMMKDNGLIEYTQAGMILSPDGRHWLPKLAKSLYEMNRLSEQEEQIREALGLDRVIIANTGDTTTSLKHLGFEAARALQDVLGRHEIVAISGGSTMAALAEQLPPKHLEPIVIPARGGVGDIVEHQANVIASVIADRLFGTYKMLHLPDGLSEESLKMLVTMEPQIKEINELAHKANVLMFGIGDAMQMVEKRRMTAEQRHFLQEKKAVGEALGQYCNRQGDIVYSINNVGITLDTLDSVDHVLAVAGGAYKAKAIIAVMRACRKGILIIDEGAADGIVEEISHS